MSASAGAARTPAVLPQVGPLARGKSHDNTAQQSPSPTEIAKRRLREDRVFKVSCVIFALVIIACMSAPMMESRWAGRTATEQNLSGSVKISGKEKEVVRLDGMPGIGPGFHREYTLGSDVLGRDVFMRALRGGRVSLLAGFGAATLGMFGAIFFGTIAGYKRGMWDAVISRTIDFMLCFPSLLLMVAMSAALATRSIGPIQRGSLGLLIVVMGTLAIPGMARLVRSLVLGLAEKEFVEAAKALGGNDARIMFRHMLPNISSVLVTYYGLMVSGMIIAEAGMSYLGLGILPPEMSWGTGISDGVPYYTTAPWITLVPGAFIVLIATSVNLIGMSVEKAFDPKNLGGK